MLISKRMSESSINLANENSQLAEAAVNTEEQTGAENLGEEVFIEMNDEARVAHALYLEVMNGSAKVSPKGTKVPLLSTKKISKVAEVSPKVVSKSFDRIRNKGFLTNDENGELFIPNIIEFEDWLKSEGAVID